MIQQCTKLPDNFPVSADMVQSSLSPKTNLDKEMKVQRSAVTFVSREWNEKKVTLIFSVQAGNVFLLDYAIMDGIPANTIKNQPQYIAAPLCLLYQHPDNGLIPIAIQVGRYQHSFNQSSLQAWIEQT